MREIGFQRTYIFKIFRGSMPPDPPRKVRLRRTITFSITYEHPLENLSYAPDYYRVNRQSLCLRTLTTIEGLRTAMLDQSDWQGRIHVVRASARPN